MCSREVERELVGPARARDHATRLDVLRGVIRDARRAGTPVTVVFVRAQQPGRTAPAVRAAFRASDTVARLGPRELLCVLPGMSEAAARLRFVAIAHLAADALPFFEAGFAALADGDDAASLVQRAAGDLRGRP
jgi:hypothetical protein